MTDDWLPNDEDLLEQPILKPGSIISCIPNKKAMKMSKKKLDERYLCNDLVSTQLWLVMKGTSTEENAHNLEN